MKVQVEVKCIGKVGVDSICKDLARFLNHNVLAQGNRIYLAAPDCIDDGRFTVRVCIEIGDKPDKKFKERL